MTTIRSDFEAWFRAVAPANWKRMTGLRVALAMAFYAGFIACLTRQMGWREKRKLLREAKRYVEEIG